MPSEKLRLSVAIDIKELDGSEFFACNFTWAKLPRADVVEIEKMGLQQVNRLMEKGINQAEQMAAGNAAAAQPTSPSA